MYDVSLITGDGVGPELANAAETVLETINDRLDVKLQCKPLPAGDTALVETGKALPDETLSAIKKSDACLKAPVGNSAADVIVVLRRLLDLYANVRPAKSYPGMPALRDGIDMVIVRENTEDLYTGQEVELGRAAVALRIISEQASQRIAEYAFQTARERGGAMTVTCVHKSNVLRVTDGIFAEACIKVSQKYPDVRLEQMYVDACAMNLIRQPEKFDVIVTTNLFGDILSDESSQAAGGLGMAPAANIGNDFAIFEPVHGAAFDIAGRNEANPSSFILSIKMMLEWLAQTRGDRRCAEAANRLESAVRGVLGSGIKTKDLGGEATTSEFAAEVVSRLGRV